MEPVGHVMILRRSFPRTTRVELASTQVSGAGKGHEDAASGPHYS